MFKRIGVMLLLALMIIVFTASVAHASVRPLTEGQHSCTNTNPEYTVSDFNVNLIHTPGSVRFTAIHNPAHFWEDAYLVTGFNRGSSAQVLCGHYGADYAYQLPVKADAPVSITGGMRYAAWNIYGRAGWDIWLTARGAEYTETTASAMERDPRTVEIMIQPGPYGQIGRVHNIRGHWKGLYIDGGNLSRVDIRALVNKSLARLGVRPSSYYYAAIDGGVEFTRGTFNLLSYNLNVSTSVTEKRSATAWATYTARHGSLAITATRRVTTSSTKTVTLPVKGAPLGVVRATAARYAAWSALASARAHAPSAAFSAAHAAATGVMFDKLHPYRRLPNVVHHHLGWAIAALHRAGFRNVSWTRHLRSNAVVHWEAGHPGKLTSVKAHIILHARRK